MHYIYSPGNRVKSTEMVMTDTHSAEGKVAKRRIEPEHQSIALAVGTFALVLVWMLVTWGARISARASLRHSGGSLRLCRFGSYSSYFSGRCSA